MRLFLSFFLLAGVALGDADRLIQGTPADSKDWPASVYARMGNAACSATLVGPRTLLIASHCVNDGGTASFSVGATAYRAKCSHHPDYRESAFLMHKEAIEKGFTPFVEERNSTADWTLCLVDKEVAGVPFEVLETDSAPLKVGDKLRMTGYGCTNPGGGGGNDGVFRIGYATVTRLPSGSNYDTVTKGGAALCFGDSGGAAFCEKSPTVRKVCGTNSRGDIKVYSYESSTYVSTALDWFKKWADKNGQRICGVHEDAKGCRGVEVPPPATEITVKGKFLSLKALLDPKAPYDVIKATAALTKAVKDLEAGL